MPRGDKTGPMGMGPMTGRAAGYCAGSGMPGYANPAIGRGFGMGFGRGRVACGRVFGGGGRGWRNMFYATGMPGWMRFGDNAVSSQEDEITLLKSQADYLNRSLDAVNRRLSQMETKKDASE